VEGVNRGNTLIPTDYCHSASQEIHRIFIDSDTSFACSQQPTISIYPEPDESNPN